MSAIAFVTCLSIVIYYIRKREQNKLLRVAQQLNITDEYIV